MSWVCCVVQARTKAQTEKIEELDTKARRFEQEAETQRHLVSGKTKELERLQSLLELTDAKHQNALRQLESKLRIELEVRVSRSGVRVSRCGVRVGSG